MPTFHIDPKHKCETCVETKLTRSSFQSIERHIKPLDLIRCDICDLKFVQTRGGNRYFITFVDDSTKYCYVPTQKNEALENLFFIKPKLRINLTRKLKC